MNKILNLVIHHSAVSRKEAPNQFNAINNYHKQLYRMKSTLGFYMGYNALIEPNGKLIVARADGEETAAVIGHNKDSLHICLAGNFDIDVPTQAQINKLKSWLGEKMRTYGLSPINIHGHRELQVNRTCPGCLIPRDWGRLLMEPLPAQPDDLKKRTDLLNFLG